MADEAPKKPTHAERVKRSGGVKNTSLRLPPGVETDWPQNLAELLEWYGNEVADVNRTAQLRIRDATKLVNACLNSEITLEKAGELASEIHARWGEPAPGFLRGKSDTEINQVMDEALAQAKQPSKGGRGR